MNKTQRTPISIISELEKKRALNYEKVATRMRIAIQIADSLEASGMSKKEFAQKMGKQQSVITKWLSGTHNFTSDTLVEIQDILRVKIKLEGVSAKTYFVEETRYSHFGINVASERNNRRTTFRIARPKKSWSDYNNNLTPEMAFC